MTHIKLKTYVTLLLMIATTVTHASNMVLANFKTAGNFGGINVENPELLGSTTNDFILEPETTAGIDIGFTQANYAPTASDTESFIQQESTDGLITWGNGNEPSWTAPTGGPYHSGSQILLKGATITLGNIDDAQTTWTYNSSNSGLLPSQMPSTGGTTTTLVTDFSATAPFGTLPTHGCFLKIEATETGTLAIGCKPSTDAAQKLVFATTDGTNTISAQVIPTIWDDSYNFNIEKGKTYYFFQLSKAGRLTSFRLTLKSLSFLLPGQKPIKVFTIGDSTMANKSNKTERGWGMLFPLFVDSSLATVSNHAADGRSTKSFIDEGRWITVLNQLSAGDYVLIQFGHNDEKTDAPLHTNPQTTYKQNLARFINETKAKGAHPVLLTPIVRRMFGSDGNLIHEHEEYAKAVRELAKDTDVPLIDMTQLSSQYENIAGITGSRALHEYFPGTEIDNTHLCQFGAYITARCVAEQIATHDAIEIPLSCSPGTMPDAYTSTLDYAQHAFAASYPNEEAATSLDDLDEQVRNLRCKARLSLSKGDDATFALVNPGFAEGFCWYNSVQATRPMGWTIDHNGTVNIKSSTAAKPEGPHSPLISSGQEHLQLWGVHGTATLCQTVTNLPNGRYEVSVKACKSGTLTATLFAGNATTTITGNNIFKVETEITDGTLRTGIRIGNASGGTIDIDDFSLRMTDNTVGVSHIGNRKTAIPQWYDLQGRKIMMPHKGIYIANGKKTFIK